MLSQEMNERLTRVGPGTPMGNLLRRYWHPIAAVAELADRAVLKTRLLGEDLVLYRDTSGTLGLLEERCARRDESLAFGIPETNGLRCRFDGWLFDKEGRCIERPGETDDQPAIRITAYPVEELGGFVFAYLGPQPAPLVPRYGPYVWDNAIRSIGRAEIPCNWVQIMENSVDPTHAEWLHGVNTGKPTALARHHVKIAFDRFDLGIVKRRLLEGQSEEVDDWRVGHPLIFPNYLLTGGLERCNFQIRVPMDDVNTLHFWYSCYMPGGEIPRQESVPVYQIPFRDEEGQLRIDFTDGQDIMAWITQGPIADRTRERLGTSDKGIVLYRRMLMEEMAKVERGEDPLGLFRDPETNRIVELVHEKEKGQFADVSSTLDLLQLQRSREQFNPRIGEILKYYERSRAAQQGATR